MSEFLKTLESQETAAPFDRVNRPKNTGKEFLGRWVRFEFHQLLIQPIQVLIALD